MTVPGSTNPLLAYKSSAAAYTVSRSLRFNAADSPRLSRTPASSGNRKTWTWSAWVKRSKISDYQVPIAAGVVGSTPRTYLRFDNTDNIRLQNDSGFLYVTTAVYRDPGAWMHLVWAVDTTNATAADRVKLYVNGTQVTSFSTATTAALNEDTLFNSTSHTAYIGSENRSLYYLDGYLANVEFVDGQQLTPSSFAETNATTGQWVPKAFSGSYGSQGYKLTFSDNSNTTAATLGKDSSGNNNNWSPSNFVAGNTRSITWSSTNPLYSSTTPYEAFDANDATYVGQQTGGSLTVNFLPGVTVSSTVELRTESSTYITGAKINGGTTVSNPNATTNWWTISFTGTMNSLQVFTSGVGTAQFWFDTKVDGNYLVITNQANNDSLVDTPTSYGTDDSLGGSVRGNYCTWNPLSKLGTQANTLNISNGNLTFTSSSALGTTGTFGMSSGKWYWELTCTSLTASQLYFGITNTVSTTGSRLTGSCAIRDSGVLSNSNGATLNGSGSSAMVAGDVIRFAYDADNKRLFIGLNGTWLNSSNPAAGTNATYTNVQGSPLFPYISDNATSATIDANFGQRAWSYTAPSGFSPLVDTSMTAPTIAKPNTVMDTVLYTGNGSSSRAITGLNFSPDFVWTKSRNQAYSHYLFDAVRGANKALFSDTTDSEQTYTSYLLSFDSAGFTVGNGSQINANGDTYVGWAWDAGSSNATNTSGTITSTVRASTANGCSIVTYIGTGANATIGHSLNVAPQLVVVKYRDVLANWVVYHSSVGAGGALRLNTTDATTSSATFWNSTTPTSTVFSVGTASTTNASGGTYVAYCWTPVAGLSSAFSFTGNGAADGPYIHLGFRPAFLLIKQTTAASTTNWVMLDSKRLGYNVDNDPQYPNLAAVDGTTDLVDFTANGFKIRSTDTQVNASAGTYIGYAWAEFPFQYARAR